MIHSARPTASPVMNLVFNYMNLVLLDFEKWGHTYVLTDGQHVKTMITTSRD